MGKRPSRPEDLDGFGPQLPVLSGFTGTRDQHGRLRPKAILIRKSPGRLRAT